MTNFTTEDLLLYLYNELNASEKLAIEKELEQNWAFKEKLSVLAEAQKRLDKMPLHSPRKKTLHSILRYALQTSNVNSH